MDDRTNKHSAKGLRTDAEQTTPTFLDTELRNFFFLVSSFFLLPPPKNK
jgi:hypothetical protein